MTYTVIIRKPSLSVSLNGTPLTGVLSARCGHGFDRRVAEATVVLTALPAGIMPWDVIEITMGGTDATAELRFSGFFVSHENTLYPKGKVLNCKGKLGLAEVLEKEVNTDMSSYAAYIHDPPLDDSYGHADEVMISTVLATCRLTGAWVPSGEDVYTGIGGTGIVLGTVSHGRGFDWLEGESGTSFIERLDSICLGYRTYDTFDGTIVRTQIAGSPAVTADYTFTEGVDIYRATETTTILEARNRVIVAGFPGYDGKHEIKLHGVGR